MKIKRNSRAVSNKSKTLRAMPDYRVALTRSNKPKRKTTRTAYSKGFRESTLTRAEEKRHLQLLAKQEQEDGSYEPPVEFNPAMRYTKDSMGVARQQLPQQAADRSTQLVQIGGMVIFERLKSTSAQFDKKPAWRLAMDLGAPNAGRYQKGGRNHYEYCHLQGCALGGKTLRGNLVAGHYAVNTYMMVIEGELQGKTELYLRVDSYASRGNANVADMIHYQVAKPLGNGQHNVLFAEVIDGRISNFSRTDADDVRQRMRQAGLR